MTVGETKHPEKPRKNGQLCESGRQRTILSSQITLADHRIRGLSTFFSTIVENFGRGEPCGAPQGRDCSTAVVRAAIWIAGPVS